MAIERCRSVEDLIARLDEEVGALVLTQEALHAGQEALQEVLRQQPAWSDLPIILLVNARLARNELRPHNPVLARSMTVLERPVRMGTLLSVVRTALQARRRQGEVRDLLEELKSLNAALEERVAEKVAQVRDLSVALTLAEHQERQRVSELLHDHLQQLLFAIGIHLELLAGGELGEPAARNVQPIQTLLEQAMQLTRNLSVELHPPVLRQDGLVEAIRWAAAQMRDQYRLEVSLTAEHDVTIPSREVMILLARSVRELLFNVVKHSGQRAARVIVARCGGEVVIRVEDEGVGYDPTSIQRRSAAGSGLRSLRDRLELLGGTMTVDTAPGRGTRTTLRMPIQ